MDYKKTERLQHGDIIKIILKPYFNKYVLGKVIDYSYVFHDTKDGVFLHVSNRIFEETQIYSETYMFEPENLLLYPIYIPQRNEDSDYTSFIKIIDKQTVLSKEFCPDIYLLFFSLISNNVITIYSLKNKLSFDVSDVHLKYFNNFSFRNNGLQEVKMAIICELMKIYELTINDFEIIDQSNNLILNQYYLKVNNDQKPFINKTFSEKYEISDNKLKLNTNLKPKIFESDSKIFSAGQIVFETGYAFQKVIHIFNKYNLLPLPKFWKYLLWNQLRLCMSDHTGSVELNKFYASKINLKISVDNETKKRNILSYIDQLLSDNTELNKALIAFDQGFKNALFLKPKEYIRSIIGCLKFFDYSYYKEYLTLFFCMNKTDNYEALQVDINGFVALNPDVKPNISSVVSELYQQNVIDFIVKLAPKGKGQGDGPFCRKIHHYQSCQRKTSHSFFRFFKSLFKNRGHFTEFINLLDSPNYSNNVDDFLNEYQQNISKKVAKENLPLDEDKYWHIIENVNANKEREEDYYEALVNVLSEFDAATILQFGIRTMVLERMAQSADLWRAAHILKSGCSDDAFEGFKRWLIIQGKEVFESAIQNPDSLSQYDFNDDWDYEFEKLADVHVEAFENKFLREAEEYISYSKVGKYAKSKILDMEDKHFEDAILKKKCPKLFEKYISNLESE